MSRRRETKQGCKRDQMYEEHRMKSVVEKLGTLWWYSRALLKQSLLFIRPCGRKLRITASPPKKPSGGERTIRAHRFAMHHRGKARGSTGDAAPEQSAYNSRGASPGIFREIRSGRSEDGDGRRVDPFPVNGHQQLRRVGNREARAQGDFKDELCSSVSG